MPKNTYCIICGEKKEGLPVKNDYVLDAIRWFKRNVSKNEKGYALVVCKADYPAYKKARSKFELRRILYVSLGLLFAVVTLILAPGAASLAIAIVLILVLYVFALLSYTPALDIKKG